MSKNFIINLAAASLLLGAMGVVLFVSGCSKPSAGNASSTEGTAVEADHVTSPAKVVVAATTGGELPMVLTPAPAEAFSGAPSATPSASRAAATGAFATGGAQPTGSKLQIGSAGAGGQRNPFALSGPSGGSYVRIGSYGASAVGTMKSTPNGGSYVRIGSFGGSSFRTASTVTNGGSYGSTGFHGGTVARFGSYGGTARQYDPFGGAARAFAGGFAGASRPLNQQLDELEQRAAAAEQCLNELIEAMKKQ